MATLFNCPDCDVEMVKGAILDRDGNFNQKISSWTEGTPSRSLKFLGIKIGSLKTNASPPHGPRYPILAFRCPKCGLLRQYAIEEELI